MTKKNDLVSEACADLEKSATLKEIEDLKVKYFGKKGIITQLLKSLGSLPSDERKQAGLEIHTVKSQLNNLFSTKLEEVNSRLIDKQIRNGTVDVTLPARNSGLNGSTHPIQQTLEKIIDIFSRLGFHCESGPEIEDEFHNFEALNISENHPARAMHDTFYVLDGKLLRTHTSPVQIRYMRQNTPPLAMIAPGKVYRCDYDQTHTPMFHQVEGLFIDENATLSNLKGLVTQFLQVYFNNSKLKMRFRPSYFPFTEPSLEIDIRLPSKFGLDGWLEVMGCGMVHPKVLNNGNIDHEKFSGFAFGMGVERLCMLEYGISDLRQFFTNDLNFLNQF